MKKTRADRENSELLKIVGGIVVIATLYFARVVFIPLALAWLFSLLLIPPVSFLERIKLPRILAIFLIVVVLVGVLGLIAWQTSQQFADLTEQLPLYKQTIQAKIHTLRGSRGESLHKASDTIKELGNEIVTVTPGSPPANGQGKTAGAPGSSPARPLAVDVVPPSNPLESLRNMLGPLATVAMVIVFTIFILIGREDLRNRFIRLAGGRLNVMTQGLDEATQRINRYLFLQLVVNSGFGVLVGGALHFIGIPNAWLWGVCAAILRFLPYVGPPLAAVMPVILSLAVFPGWHEAILTALLFLVLELVLSNFVEPVLYGAHIGLSPLALLVSAVFWTFIWGFPGLVLSTPLTVCLVVLGRYVPNLNFLNVLLGDEPVLPPEAQYYQRLLAADENEARQVLEQFLKEKPLEELYGSVVIPALSLAEQDRHRNELDAETQNFIYQSTREIIEELDDTTSEGSENPSELSTTKNTEERNLRVLCIPARDDADDVVGMLLARLLERQGLSAQSIPICTTTEMLSHVSDSEPDTVCISALAPFALNHARALYLKLHAHSPDLHIVVCLWHFAGDLQKAKARLKLSEDHGLFTTMPQVLEYIALRTQTIRSESH
jgi:predicted PurR-regulated permease PerM